MFMAGGTDVLPNIKRRIATPDVVIGLSAASDMQQVVVDADGRLRIGAGVKIATIERSQAIGARYPALSEAASLISTPQIRRLGTIGGNICLDVRCNYYNQSEHLAKIGGLLHEEGE